MEPSNIEQPAKVYYVGIRREDKSVWERRVPLTPQDVQFIIQKYPNIHFIVQPSTKRIFKDKDYAAVGATLDEDLSKCGVILGVKEIPISALEPEKTYLFFAHVIKAQEAGMPLLDALLEKRIRLIDYEPIKDHSGKRLVAFGHFAGNAGAIDFLSGIGKILLANGFSTPFLQIGMTYTYYNLAEAKEGILKVGKRIVDDEIPTRYQPMIFAVTGSGRCADGCLEILKLLPHKIVAPEELADIVAAKGSPEQKTTIYITQILPQHMVEPDGNFAFDKADYYERPNSYRPIFHEKYLPYISVIFNCIFWDARYPRLITCEQMQKLAEGRDSRLFGVSDITCDFEGSIEFLKRFTTIDQPFYVYDPIDMKIYDDPKDCPQGILYESVDHLPSELPYDASVYFGSKLRGFIAPITYSDVSKPLVEQGLPPEIERAVVTLNGELTPNFSYITRLREANEKLKASKNYTAGGLKQMKRVKSFASIRIEGHLFDTLALNKIVDGLTTMMVKFSFIEWIVGKNNEQPSSVVLQVYSKEMDTFLEVLEFLEGVAEKSNLTLQIDK
eukprot:TRINITY_DN3759_c0_g2_i1.p1 TRINITY_DN3759_c0_g2~~TRINITY_DN3759_c0_g2_i1.p1  ORF type:complete len:557 (+),score=152.08 TRINITY_DN3759_c0_g2_i1:52-1722(+)